MTIVIFSMTSVTIYSSTRSGKLIIESMTMGAVAIYGVITFSALGLWVASKLVPTESQYLLALPG
jgi:hypothetical protein